MLRTYIYYMYTQMLGYCLNTRLHIVLETQGMLNVRTYIRMYVRVYVCMYIITKGMAL